MRFHGLNKCVVGCLRLPYEASTISKLSYVMHSLFSVMALVWFACGLLLSGEVFLREYVELISGQVIESEPVALWLPNALFEQHGLSSFLAIIFVFMAPILVGAALASIAITLVRYQIIAGMGLFLLILAMPLIILFVALTCCIDLNAETKRMQERLGEGYLANQSRRLMKVINEPVS